MAATQRFELDVLEKQWIVKALESQRNMVVRARNREMAGSEIYMLRSKEIQAIDAIHAKFAV